MSALTATRHAAVRMAQRHITLKDAELIVMIGTEVEGGFFVRNKDYLDMEHALKALLGNFRRLVGKRLVLASGQIVTAYHATDSEERRLMRRARRLAR